MPDAHLPRLLYRSLCWGLFCCVVTSVGGAWAGTWTRVRQVERVDLYLRAVSGSDIPAVRGITHFDVSPDEVFRVISDYDHFAGFIPLVSESRVLEKDVRTAWVYQRLDLPLPIADRHYIIRVDNLLNEPARDAIDVTWQLDRLRSQSLPAKDALLPDAFSGSWHLQSTDGEAGCDAVYTVHVEPGGALPDWLFVRVTRRYVVQVMDAVRRRIERVGR